MIWLASFPRSGNSFLRNVLFEVYGLESSTYHREEAYPVEADYLKYPIIKTHLLPNQLEPVDPTIPAAYLVRDGRDALVSIAHHRKDIMEPGSDFEENLYEAIMAEEGSFFGGWSSNVNDWLKRTDVIIRFEDLIKDPLAAAARLGELVELPQANPENLPSFEKLKSGTPQYGSGKHFFEEEEKKKNMASLWFRKGKVGSWKDEMPEYLHDLFWRYHGETMERIGYTYEGEVPTLQHPISWKGIKQESIEYFEEEKKFHVLVEASKLMMAFNDGVKRYLMELLRELLVIVDDPESCWQVDLYMAGEIIPIQDYRNQLMAEEASQDGQGDEMALKQGLFKLGKTVVKQLVPTKTYNKLAVKYGESGIRYKWHVMKSNVLQSIASNKLSQMVKDYDLIHLPLPQHFEPFKRVKANYITTVHDLTHRIFPEYHVERNIQLAEAGMEFLSNSGSHVIAISESTKNDLNKDYAIAAEKLHVVYEAADNNAFKVNRSNTHISGLVHEKYGIPNEPYILCLSTLEPRKNLRNTMLAFKKLLSENPGLELNLVIAGKNGWKSNQIFKDTELECSRIIFTGFVDEVFLPVLYSEALALSYVSFYEGFGLPLVEAFSCDTPVIYGNNSSMPEVAGKAGLPANPEDVNDIKEQMRKIFFDKELHAELVRQARKRTFTFSWRKTALDTLKAYKEAIVSQS